MGEPMQNFVYHTNDSRLRDWVQSTSLALDGRVDSTSHPDEPTDQSPDDFYRSTYHTRPSDLESTPSNDMTSTRQRQPPPNGPVKSPTKPSVRSVSGPASVATIAATRAAQVPVNRPTVKSLAQRFNQPSSAEPSPPPTRVRTSRPSSSTRSITEAPGQSASATSSPARPTKEAAYGSYKFNNLKPRERPQPAPASPASVRRTNDRTSRDGKTTPSRRKLSSPTRSQPQRASTGRQPFFGEVVGAHDETTPGFGIPSAEPSINDPEPVKMPSVERSTIKLVDDDFHVSPKVPYSGNLPVRHGRFPSDMASRSAAEGQQAESPRQRDIRRHSPPSRIPVATRRTSVASDSGSSNRSSKPASARPSGDYRRNSPVRSNGLANANESANLRKLKTQTPQTLPAASYRGYRERGKSPQNAGAGTSLAAVITAPLPPTSPRLRHSRERQLLTSQESSGATIRSVDASESEDYFENGNGFRTQDQSHRFLSEEDQIISLLGSNLDSSLEPSADTFGAPSSHSLQPGHSTNESDSNKSTAHQQPLTVHTSSLLVPHIPAPLSATTDFEQDESPILGMPGSFMMTPPIAQYTPPLGSGQGEPQHAQSPPNDMLPGELLQARAFRPLGISHTAETPDSAMQLTGASELGVSEIGFRESIPIMLGVDEEQSQWAAPTTRPGHASRLSIGAHRWRAEPLDSSGTISYLDEDDSPIDPFANRDSIRPDDSASVAFYRQTEHQTPDWTPKIPSTQESRSSYLTMDSEAYSVINKVLNLYHGSSVISPEVAYDSQKQVHKVSPVIAQHEDWGSKEATETYLARLLSDATATDERNVTEPALEESNHTTGPQVPSLSIRELDEDPAEHTGGTAIIFPPESRRYSRGSRGSNTTTIYDDGSRADSSSVNLARDSARDEFASSIHLPSSTYAPHPPPKDWKASHHADTSHTTAYQPRTSHDHPVQSFGSLLPEIEGAGEGLGLSLQAKQQDAMGAFHYPPPPRPAYSPPPPPTQPSIDRVTNPSVPYTPSVYNRQPPSSIIPSAPLPSKLSGPFTNAFEVPDHAFDGVSGEHPIHHNDGSDPVEPRDPFRGSVDAGSLQSALTPNSTTAPTVTGNSTKDADPVTQALKQRYRVMAELIKTEQLFCVDMMVAYSVFEATSGDCLTDRERRTLFCNSQDIDKLSHELYQDLKRAARSVVNPQKSPADRREEREKRIAGGEEVEDEEIVDDGTWDEFKCVSVETDQQTRIGEVMNEHMPQIERLFTTYLLNHADASNFIKSKSDDGGVLGWVQACFVHSKDLTNAWDLDSLLVKPVQRLMKYPLLLDSLEKATPADHPDFAAIKTARAEIVEINVRINQAKKRQETMREATKEGKKQKNKGTLETRLGKTFFVKPFSSKVDKAKQPTGSALAFSDDEYDFLAQKFGGHFFQIQVVMRDINTYLDTMTEFMCNTNCLVLTFIALMESAPSSHPEIESSWRRQAMAFFELQQVALEDHKNAVRSKVQNTIVELWGLHGRPQKLMDQRKKGLSTYMKYKQALERKEKIDPKLEDAGQSFIAINTTLKIELPKLYDLTKKCVRACLSSFIFLQKEWWKNCQKKILPLLEYEPEHTTSITFDLKAYVDRFHSDFASVEAVAGRLAIANRGLLTDVQNYASPLPTYVDDSSSSRKSSSRRTESMSSDASLMEPRKRYSGGYNSQRTAILPRSSPAIHTMLARERDRALSPNSERSDNTIGTTRRQTTGHYTGLDGAFDNDFGLTSSMGSSLLSPASNPGSSRTSGVFNSALPMFSSDFSGSHETAPTTPATPTNLDEPEVLFLAASLFEFNIAHDRREGGIPYLVYVPGEIFDVIGMKGELWLARNQDDSTRTVGWIWEKHFARILPEDG